MLTEGFYVWSERVITPLNLITGCVNNCSQALTDAEAEAELQPTRSDFYLTHVQGWWSNCSPKVTTTASVSGRCPAAGPEHTRAQGQGRNGWMLILFPQIDFVS